MDSSTDSPKFRKDKLAAIPDAGNRANMNPCVILKSLNYEDAEEMKENITTTPPRRPRRLSRAPRNSLELNTDSKTYSRPKRHLNKPNYLLLSSDDEDGRNKLTSHGRGRKSNRKSAAQPVIKDYSSVEEDSALECEEPQESWISKILEGDPTRKTPIKLNLKRVRSFDLTKTSKVEESKPAPNHESPPKSPKRKIEESDSDAPNVTKRRPRRCPFSDDETTDVHDDIPQETSSQKLTRTSAKQREAGNDVPLSPANGANRCVEDDAADCEGTRETRTPKTAKIKRQRKSRLVDLSQLRLKDTSGEEDSDVVTGRPSRSSAMAARRSLRIKSEDDDSDFLQRGCWERLPKTDQTPRSKRNKTPSARNKEDCAEDLSEAADDVTLEKTPKSRGKTPKKKSPAKTPRNLKPSMPARTNSTVDPESALDEIRANLHVSTVPKCLPCREKEFNDIYYFAGAKIGDSAGGCMYISGMPGTGKTATVHAVVRRLEEDVADGKLPPFQFIEVNGLKLTEPRQVFVRILQELTGEKCTPQHAQEILAKKFTSARGCKNAVLLLVDEVDMLRNRRQDVMYNLFDWPSKAYSKLIVLTIANTMDLPERLLMGRVTSRLGLTRLTFEPYGFKQLQEIVTARLQGSDCFNPDAVQLVARKVAAVSGDARRALDICRRATELLTPDDERVSTDVVNTALSQMMNSASIKTLKACSRMEKLFLQAVVAETKRTGVEETNFNSVYRQFTQICNLDCIKVPNVSQSLSIVNRLGSSRILMTEHGKADIMQTIYLNVNDDDIHYAMTKPVAA